MNAFHPMNQKHHTNRQSQRLRSMDRRSANAGFTLVELMVAIMAGLIAIASIYSLSAASARHFHEQQRIAQTQMSLRMAMTQFRRDLVRAGYLGTSNSQTEQTCIHPATPIAAIDSFVNDDAGSTAWLPNAAENGVSADRIILTGNYASPEGYLAQGLSGAGNEVFLQEGWQAFRRSFGVPFNDQAFTEVFQVGRLLPIRTQQGNHFFTQITSLNTAGSPRSISIAAKPMRAESRPGESPSRCHTASASTKLERAASKRPSTSSRSRGSSRPATIRSRASTRRPPA